METLKRAICIAALITGAAVAEAQDRLDRRFAECAGRFSAEREHAWLTGDRDADQLDRQRKAFLALMEATPRLDTAQAALAYRIEAKMAHAALLSQASFSLDAGRADRARQLAAHHFGTCQSLLLGG